MSEQLTVKEFAAQARVTERTVRRWIKEGRLQAHRHGKKYLISAEQREGSAPPVRPVDLSQPGLSRLLFWICDAWVDNGRARHQLLRQSPEQAEQRFLELVASVDQAASTMNDEDLALRLRFIARDLLASVRREPAQAAEPQAATVLPAAAATQPLAPEPMAPTAPLSSALETMPLRPAKP